MTQADQTPPEPATETFSLVPPEKRPRRRLPKGASLRVLVGCLVALAGCGAAASYLHQQRGQAAFEHSLAQAEQQRVNLEATRLREQLQGLEQAGGADRLQLVRRLANSRVNWKQVFIDIAKVTPSGVSLEAASAVAPDSASNPGSTSDPNPTVTHIQLNGSADSKAQLESFIRQLKSLRRFNVVDLRSASNTEQAVHFDLGIGLVPPPPPPGAGAVQVSPSGTS